MPISIACAQKVNAAHAAVLTTSGTRGPEGLVFIPASDSPNGKPLLLVGYEVSGSTAIFQLNLAY